MKSKIKYIFAVILALVLIILPSCKKGDNNSVTTPTDEDNTSVTDGGFNAGDPDTQNGSVGLKYELSEDGKYYTLVGLGDCLDVDIIVPEAHEGLPVKAIAKGAFESENVLSIYIPDNVEDLQMGMLIGCDSLKSLTMPSTELNKMLADSRHPDGNYIVSPGDDIPTLNTVTMTKGIKVDYYTFYNACPNLEELTLPETLTDIALKAFIHTPKLKDIVIPAAVKSIGDEAFKGCSNLRSVKFDKGSKLTSIGEYAFNKCTKLVSVEFDDNCKISKLPKHVFSECKALKSLKVPLSVERIYEGAFLDCTHLTEVVLPEGLKEIDSWAFRNTRLAEVNIPSTVTKIGDQAFYESEYIKNVNIAEGNSTYYAGGNCVILKDGDILLFGVGEMTIPESVKEIRAYAFSNNTTLKSITIPKSVVIVREFAFENCSTLRSVKFADGSECKTIERFAFIDCRALEEIELPSGVEVLGSGVFRLCYALKKVTIPETVSTLPEALFQECITLEEVNILSKPDVIPASFFEGCNKLEKIVLPGSVTRIEQRAMSSGLKEITIPKACKTFDDQAFYGCVYLEKINYEGTVSQWNSIKKGYYFVKKDAWNEGFKDAKIVCSDGNIN